MDLFSAGSETSSTTLSWALMHLTLNKNVQRQCQMEIDQYLGGRLLEIEITLQIYIFL